jgi:hypothetical protein
MVMKLKLLILPLVVLVVLLCLFSGQYTYLNEYQTQVVPSPDGNPTLMLEDGVYYVRYWNLAPGCYKLTSISLLDYKFASQADESRCPVQAKSN